MGTPKKKLIVMLGTFDTLTLDGRGFLDGKEVKLHQTYAFGPTPMYFDETNRAWVDNRYEVRMFRSEFQLGHGGTK